MSEFTNILEDIAKGKPQATERLFPIVYHELRQMAARQMKQESPGQTLQATALVHEAWLRLVGPTDSAGWDNRAHFFAAAAESMRRILIETARRRTRLKHGAGHAKVDLEAGHAVHVDHTEEIFLVHEALDQLEACNPEAAQVVKLRYFAGFSIDDTASAMQLSPRRVDQIWAYAKAWLKNHLEGD